MTRANRNRESKLHSPGYRGDLRFGPAEIAKQFRAAQWRVMDEPGRLAAAVSRRLRQRFNGLRGRGGEGRGRRKRGKLARN